MTRCYLIPARFRAVIDQKAKEHGVRVGKILTRRHGQRESWPVRDEIIATFRTMTLPSGETPSYPLIGKWLWRHHTSVMLAERRHKKRVESVLEIAKSAYTTTR